MNEKKTMTELLIEQLARRGLNPRAEVRTAAGVADIVTDNAVFEVVPVLTAKALMDALGRVTRFREALGESCKGAVIYGRPSTEDIGYIEIMAREERVTINVWKDGSRPGAN